MARLPRLRERAPASHRTATKIRQHSRVVDSASEEAAIVLRDCGSRKPIAFGILAVMENGELKTSSDLASYMTTDRLALVGTRIRHDSATRGATDGFCILENRIGEVMHNPRERAVKVAPARPDRLERHARGRDTRLSALQVHGFPTITLAAQSNDLPQPVITAATGFHMSETDKVTRFYLSKLQELQQLSDKKIAKAWIKAICPKKQALCPYTDKKGAIDGRLLEVPEWWPDVSVCEFREPDHLKREPRKALMIHLLRLRPTPEQLAKWNSNDVLYDNHVRVGWTKFLSDAADPASLDDDAAKSARKQRLLTQVYEVAAKEEDFERFAIDQHYAGEYDETPKPASKSRGSKRAVSVASTFSDGDTESSSLSTTRSHPTAKRQRRKIQDNRVRPYPEPTKPAPGHSRPTDNDTKPAPSDSTLRMDYSTGMHPASSGVTAAAREVDTKPIVDGVLQNGLPHMPEWMNTQIRNPQPLIELHAQHQHPLRHQWPAYTPSPSSSFDATDAGGFQYHNHYGMNVGHSDFPGNHNSVFSQIQVQHASHPEPQWDTVPNTPIYSPSQLMHLHADATPAYNAMVEGMQHMHGPTAVVCKPYHAGPVTHNGPYLNSEYIGGPLQQAPSFQYVLDDPYAHHASPLHYEAPPFGYPDRLPAPDLQAAGRVMRGFTGHSSGVGGGQPT